MKEALMAVAITAAFFIGVWAGSTGYAEKHRLAAEEMWKNRNTSNDVFTACLIEGWSKDGQFRRAWANAKVQCGEPSNLQK